MFQTNWQLKRLIRLLQIHAGFIHYKLPLLFSLEKWIQLILDKNESMPVNIQQLFKEEQKWKKKDALLLNWKYGINFFVFLSYSINSVPTYSLQSPISITCSTWRKNIYIYTSSQERLSSGLKLDTLHHGEHHKVFTLTSTIYFWKGILPPRSSYKTNCATSTAQTKSPCSY